jgi:hypothetical protein
MADKEQLKPDDFPVHAEQNKIVKPDGKGYRRSKYSENRRRGPERPNAEENRRKQDRWA